MCGELVKGEYFDSGIIEMLRIIFRRPVAKSQEISLLGSLLFCLTDC